MGQPLIAEIFLSLYHPYLLFGIPTVFALEMHLLDFFRSMTFGQQAWGGKISAKASSVIYLSANHHTLLHTYTSNSPRQRCLLLET